MEAAVIERPQSTEPPRLECRDCGCAHFLLAGGRRVCRHCGRAAKPDKFALQFGRAPKQVCPVHQVEMTTKSSPRGVRYSYCPVPGCECSAKESR